MEMRSTNINLAVKIILLSLLITAGVFYGTSTVSRVNRPIRLAARVKQISRLTNSQLSVSPTSVLQAKNAMLVAQIGKTRRKQKRSQGRSTKRTKKRALQSGYITYADPVGKRPDFIFPIQGRAVFSTTNYQDFDYLMYRPLYWFSGSPAPSLNEQLSPAYPPVFSNHDKTVTIKMKMWKWSDGETVNAEDVAFWLNLVKIEGPQGRFAPYLQTGIPSDLADVKIISPSVLQLTLDSPVNPSVFTDDDLSQIIPLPLAWDVYDQNGQPGQGGCAPAAFTSVILNAQNQPDSASAKACESVYEFLAQQSGYEPIANHYKPFAYLSFASDPLWQVVDGPWRLASMDSSGEAVFEPNNAYSGPIKPKVAEFIEVPFSSYTDEAVALALGQLSIGYLTLPEPPSSSGTSSGGATETTVTVPVTSSSGQTLENLSNTEMSALTKSFYRQIVYYGDNVNFAVYNFYRNSSLSGKLLRLPYIRKALQYLVDQPLIIKKIYDGFAEPDYSLVPGYNLAPVSQKPSGLTKTKTTSSQAVSGISLINPYPYDPKKAVAILKANGWKINRGGIDTCVARAGCGTSITQGTQLQLEISYLSGDATLADELNMEVGSFALAGVEMGLVPVSSGQINSDFSACVLQSTSCNFEIEDFGGWNFGLSYAPTGQSLLNSGSSSDVSNFVSPLYESLLSRLLSTYSGTVAAEYEKFLEFNLPVLYQPTPAQALIQVRKNLDGFTGFGPSGSITPESWYFVKKK